MSRIIRDSRHPVKTGKINWGPDYMELVPPSEIIRDLSLDEEEVRTFRKEEDNYYKRLAEKMSKRDEELGQELEADAEKNDRIHGLKDPIFYFNGSSYISIRMVETLKMHNTYCYGYDEERGTGLLMIYKNGVYRPAIEVDVEIQRLLGERSTQHHINETIESLKRDVPRLPWEQWNKKRLFINCKNGMLDPATLKLQDHSPKSHSTFQLPVKWNPEVDPNRIDSFLSELLPQAEVTIVLEIIGYLSTSDISAKHFFIFEGEGNTGKTELLTLIKNFIGSRNIAIMSLQDLADNRFASANLENKLLAIFDDIGDIAIQNTSAIKVLTGKFPTIRVEHKGVDAYHTPLYARMLFTCNMMPTCYTDHTEAWYSRPLIIPFRNEFTGDRIERGLTEKLAETNSLERLFFLAATELNNLIAHNMQFEITESMREAAAAYRKRSDTVRGFVDECCILSPEEHVHKTWWYEKYVGWCDDCRCKPLGRNKAYTRLLSIRGISDDKEPGGNRIFRGISVKDDF